MSTPGPRNVRWNLEDPASALNSPASNTSTEFVSTSSLQYINSQLIAHGFTAPPGLSLDGVASADMEKAVKCLLAMLSQRVDDMSRTETLSTKLRTLTYDHERLKSMYDAAEERAANAEREMNTYKSRLANANKALHASESAHKHTTTELQRTRSSLQSIRTLHQNELKKKDKEIDRMADKWAKLAEAQSKLGSTAPSGMRCLNGGLADAGMAASSSQTFLEASLEESERARMEIIEENKHVKGLVVTAVNGMQEIVHEAREDGGKDEWTPATVISLFPISPASAAKDAILDSIDDLRATIARLMPSDDPAESTSTSKPSPQTSSKIPPEEVARLQDTIKKLQAQIADARKDQSNTRAVKQSEKDVERERLEGLRSNLDDERKKITQEAIKLEKERAAMEAEKYKMEHEEDKRKTEVEKKKQRKQKSAHSKREQEEQRPTPADADMADEPHEDADADADADMDDEAADADAGMSILAHVPAASPSLSLYGSPRRSPATLFPSPGKLFPSPAKIHTTGSPRKVSSGSHKTASPRKVSAHKLAKIGRAGSPRKVSKGSPRKASKPKRGLMPSTRVEPAYETEVLPHMAGGAMEEDKEEEQHDGAGGSRHRAKSAGIEGRSNSSEDKPAREKSAGLLPTFVLPPPSPRTSLPPQPALPPMAFPPLNLPSLSAAPTPSAPVAAPSSAPLSTLPPRTPGRGYPVAKPLASRMIHAYSPAQPSPLSRILMLGNSPGSDGDSRPPISALDPLREEDEHAMDEEEDGRGVIDDDDNPFSPMVTRKPMSLAEELGVTLSPPSPPPAPAPTRDTKGKGRAVAPPSLAGNKRPLDKENAGDKAKKKKKESRKEKEKDGDKAVAPAAKTKAGASSTSKSSGRETRSSTSKTATAASSRAGSSRETRSKASSPPPKLRVTGAGGGPRRVPIDSAEAPKLRPRKA
ncbi:Afadin and alpha-actinin-binding-domain-containing protein [Schizophyllum commune]